MSTLQEEINKIPRRARLDLNTPAELAIREAVDAVEDVGTHPLLTDVYFVRARATQGC